MHKTWQTLTKTKKNWPNLTKSNTIWQNLTKSDQISYKNWWKLTKSDKSWLKLTKTNKIWQQLTKTDKIWQNLTKSNKILQNVYVALCWNNMGWTRWGAQVNDLSKSSFLRHALTQCSPTCLLHSAYERFWNFLATLPGKHSNTKAHDRNRSQTPLVNILDKRVFATHSMHRTWTWQCCWWSLTMFRDDLWPCVLTIVDHGFWRCSTMCLTIVDHVFDDCWPWCLMMFEHVLMYRLTMCLRTCSI
jgi:hypothetical protein